MHKLAKLSTKAKVMLLVLYTAIISLIMVALITFVFPNKDTRYQNYQHIPSDENLVLTIRTRERRDVPSITNEKGKETSTWDLAIYATRKDTTSIIQNVHVFITIKTSDGTNIFKDNKSSSFSGTYLTLLSATGISKTTNAYNNTTEKYEKNNLKPIGIYVYTYYEIRNASTLKYEPHIIQYEAEGQIADFSEFAEFEERDVIKGASSSEDGKFLNKNELFDLSVEVSKKNEEETATKDTLRTKILYNSLVASDLDVTIKNMNIEVYAKIDNHKSDTENYFPDYLLLAKYQGTLLKTWTISAVTSDIDKAYNISNIFVVAKVVDSKDEVRISKFWVNYSELKIY